MLQFLSTPSARRATWAIHELLQFTAHFYPRPPRGGRHYKLPLDNHRRNFYPRPPRGGRPILGCPQTPLPTISIHALREEGDTETHSPVGTGIISIHALREEGDLIRQSFVTTVVNFYPRPPRGGRRHIPGLPNPSAAEFLSTPSARRATHPCNY